MLRYLLGGFAALCLFFIAQNVVAHSGDAAPVEASPYAAPMAVSAPTASATMVDVNATNAASGYATMSAAQTQSAADQTRAAQLTHDAETQLAAARTSTAVQDQATIVSAQKTEIIAQVMIMGQTLTAYPTQQWREEYAYWHTQSAIETNALLTATIDARERWQEDAIDRSTAGAFELLIWGSVIIALIGLFGVLSAIAYLIKGQRGAQAQLTLDGAASIPGTKSGKPHDLITDGERAQVIAFVDECIKASGPEATKITKQSQFESAETWSQMVRRLRAMGLVTPERGNGNGTDINGGLTLGGLAVILRKGVTA